MAKPQQPELRRSGFTPALEPDSIASELEARDQPGATGGPGGPVPEENLPGHRPEEEQDKPSGDDFVAKVRAVAAEAAADDEGADDDAAAGTGPAAGGEPAAKASATGSPAKKGTGRKAPAKASARPAAARKEPAKRATKGTSRKAAAPATAVTPEPVARREDATPPPRPVATQTSAPTAPSAPAAPPVAPRGLRPQTTYGNVVGALAEAPIRFVLQLVRGLRGLG
jgi:hypothetical protein